MDAGGISVARTLPIDGALVADVLNRLRRDTPGAIARWTLGGHGTAEMDVDFFPVVPSPSTSVPRGPRALACGIRAVSRCVKAVIELTGSSAESCELTLRPALPVPPWWTARLPELLDLGHAALDELSEELLWHATRDGVSTGTD